MSAPVPQGTRFDKYEIRSQLGKGGMGEVYLAHDTKLGRAVALKILSPALIKSSDQLRRFTQEARATSSLNHPNILTIHDIGYAESTYYIAAEFIDGVTLRQQLTTGRLKLGEALEVCMQVSKALAAAHDAGIIHRDIKPENIMLRADGYVKVLDFGLAKLTESSLPEQAGPEASTEINIHTDPQAVIGTVYYMSPEQLRGQPLDTRTDIWSLGVVLYEMVAGCRPFAGPTKSDTIASILRGVPVPLSQYVDEVPTELQLIVTKLLREDRDGRYQTAKELLSDLKGLKQALDSEEQVARAQPQTDSSGLAASNDGRATAESVTKHPQTDDAGVARATSSIEFLVSEAKRHKNVTLLLIAMLAAGLVAVGYWYHNFSSQTKLAEPLQRMTIIRLRSGGNVVDAAISPDGKYVATVLEAAGAQSLWVRQIAAAGNIQLTAPKKTEYRGLTFSPDSSYIYFLRAEDVGGVLYQMPVLGGLPPRKLIENISSAVTFSPDGRQLAFIRKEENEKATALILANADGSGERRLAVRQRPEFFDLGGPQMNAGPAWSPDGKVIACPTLNIAEPAHMNVVEVSLRDGAMRQINTQHWDLIGRIMWLADGSGLVMNAVDQSISTIQLWRLSYPGGEARRITNDLEFYKSVSLTADSQMLVTVQSDQTSNIWLTSGSMQQETQISPIADSAVVGVAWMPDGRLIYSSNESESQNLWAMDRTGKNHTRLTFEDGMDREPAVSPDGHSIVFVSQRTGGVHLWEVDADGSNARQLTYGTYEDSPCFSGDGRWIVYHSLDPAGDSVWKLPAGGGTPLLVIAGRARQSAVSADGKQIACFYHDEQINSSWRIRVMSFEGGQTLREFAVTSDVDPARPGLRWTPDGLAVTYVATTEGISNVWKQPLNGGSVQQLTHFKEDRIFWFDWSRDGEQLACVRGAVKGSALLIKGFK